MYYRVDGDEMLIKVPFAFNDVLRACFKTASGQKRRGVGFVWVVKHHPQNINKFEQLKAEFGEQAKYLEQAQQLFEVTVDFDAVRFDAVAKLRAALDAAYEHLEAVDDHLFKARRNLVEVEDKKKRLFTTKKLVTERYEILELLHDETLLNRESINKEAQEIAAIVGDAIDMAAVDAAKKVMISKSGQHGTKNKDAFAAAQAVIKKESDKLKLVGWLSRGLLELSGMTSNRPDRDNPAGIGLPEIMDIFEIDIDV